MRRGLPGGLHSPQSRLSGDQGSPAAEISAADGAKAKRLSTGFEMRGSGWERKGPTPSSVPHAPLDRSVAKLILQRVLREFVSTRKSRLFLAGGTVKGGALALAQLADGGAAVAAGAALHLFQIGRAHV